MYDFDETAIILEFQGGRCVLALTDMDFDFIQSKLERKPNHTFHFNRCTSFYDGFLIREQIASKPFPFYGGLYYLQLTGREIPYRRMFTEWRPRDSFGDGYEQTFGFANILEARVLSDSETEELRKRARRPIILAQIAALQKELATM